MTLYELFIFLMMGYGYIFRKYQNTVDNKINEMFKTLTTRVTIYNVKEFATPLMYSLS